MPSLRKGQAAMSGTVTGSSPGNDFAQGPATEGLPAATAVPSDTNALCVNPRNGSSTSPTKTPTVDACAVRV